MRERRMSPGFDVEPVRWEGTLHLLDQRLLPDREAWVTCRGVSDAVEAIGDLTVRGAPAIGVAAAYAMVLAVPDSGGDLGSAMTSVRDGGEALKAARPTAVNLAWAVDRQLEVASAVQAESAPGIERLRDALLESARSIHESEVAACRRIGSIGADLVPDGASVLTHCNAGALATGGYGSALGIVRGAVEAGKQVHVWVDETRPVLQGARLTAWELTRAGIPNTLIADVAAASVIARGDVDVVIVGADRIAANGDVANKIGTYGVALAASAHSVPFVVAAPVSTVDMACPSGDAIVIEERDPGEVLSIHGQRIAPRGQVAANWAFDVTPHRLVTAIITEAGVARAPYPESFRYLAGGT